MTDLTSLESSPISGYGNMGYGSLSVGSGINTDTSGQSSVSSVGADQSSSVSNFSSLLSSLLGSTTSATTSAQTTQNQSSSVADQFKQTIQAAQQAELAGQPLSVNQSGVLTPNPNLYGSNPLYTAAWNKVASENQAATGNGWAKVVPMGNNTIDQQAQLNMTSLDQQIAGNISAGV
jgi:hypothetical protein